MQTGKAVRKLRTAAGLSQQDLADQISVHATTISLIECGKTKFGVETLKKICKALKIQFHHFILLASERGDLYYTPKTKIKEYNAVFKKMGNNLKRVV